VVVDTSFDDSEFVEQNEIQDHVPNAKTLHKH
jgi:hypothetical protein